MGGYAGNAPIVTDGLVFCVDPSNEKSYAGTGTALNDLVGSNNFTLYNGLETGITLPWMDCDGLDDYAGAGTGYTPNVFKFQYTSAFSIGVWMKLGFSDSDTVFPVLLSSMATTSPYSGFNISAGVGGTRTRLAINLRYDAYSSYERSFLASSLSTNTPYYYVATYSGVRGQQFKLYINGSQVSATSNSLGTTSPTITYNNELRLGNWFSSVNPWVGSIGPTHVYNKELSSAEVLQNYNALKNRFV